MTTLRLNIPATWDAHHEGCEWVILDRQGKVLRRGKDVLGEFPQCDETEVVVPAAMVGFMSAQLPPGNRNKVLAALPFLVEAGLISAPEDTHAVLAAQSDAQVLVAVIQKSWVKHLMEKLARGDIFPTRMFPETLLPDLPYQGWSMVCRGHESFVRTSANQGFTLDIDHNSALAPFVLTLALKQAQVRPKGIVVYGELPKYAADWALELGVELTRAVAQEWFVHHSQANSQARVNLLQGEFKPFGGVSRQLAAFKPVAITLAALLLMQLTFSVLDYAVKVRENRTLDQAMVTQFKATFPEASTVVDAPLQMQRNLDELKHGAGQSGNADFMPLLSAVTASVDAISSQRLTGMDYANGKLVLNLRMPDMAQAEAMRQRLSASGLVTNIENSHSTAQGVALQLVISERVS